MTRSIICFHVHCPDGAMSAAIALHALRSRGEPEPILIPAQYQRPLWEVIPREQVEGAVVYVLDFSFSPKETDELAKVAEKVVVLDHHRSAMQRFVEEWGWKDEGRTRDHVWRVPKIYLTLDQNHSGAALTWQHFHPGESMPSLVAHVEDYDLWRHRLPYSKAIHAYLRSLDMDVEQYIRLLNDTDIADPIRDGNTILRANDQQARALASKPETVTFSGLTCLAVNAPLHQDDIGDLLAAQCAAGVGVMWYWRDGQYKVSLRSRSVDGGEPFDCSAVARHYGGGGHRGAASFTCQELPWKTR